MSSVAKVKKTKIKVIGIGGGAGMIVSEIAFEIKQACFVAANTDAQALKTISKKVSRFQFGQALTGGLGTGMNSELGREAAQNEKERIKKLCQGQDICIIVACLGGGTGSGAASVFAKISKELGNLTYGIFTLPFKFEGEKKMEISKEALAKIKNHLSAMTIIPNERVFQVIDKETPLKQSFSFVNKNLAENLKGLIETIYNPGLINIDFADIQTIFEGQGKLAYLNTVELQTKEASVTQAKRYVGEGDSSSSIKDLMAKLLNSPLYPYKIQGAKGVLFNIAGEKNLSLSEVNQISKSISELVNPEAKIIFGISQKRKYSKTIKTFLLAVGCLGKKQARKASLSSLPSPLSGARQARKASLSSLPSPLSGARRARKASLSSLPSPLSGARRAKKDGQKKEKKKKIKKLKREVIERPLIIKEEKQEPIVELKIRKREKFFKKKIKNRTNKKTKKKTNKIKPIAQASEANTGQKKNEKYSLPETPDVKKEKVGEEDKSSSSTHRVSERDEDGKENKVLFDFASLRSARVRKNGLQIKKEAQDLEREMLEKEKFWETPAFLRRKKDLPS